METVGVEAGVWKVVQDSRTRGMSLQKYGHTVATWPADRLYTFDELYEILVTKSNEMRGEQ